MTKRREQEPGRGGEPGGARLLELARRELLEDLLPQLQGEGRYRARLVANAMKIAARELDAELDGGPADRTAGAHRLRGLAAAALPGGVDLAALGEAEVAAALCAALRSGRLDGQRELYDLLVTLTGKRREAIG
jgi:hypothetical protein